MDPVPKLAEESKNNDNNQQSIKNYNNTEKLNSEENKISNDIEEKITSSSSAVALPSSSSNNNSNSNNSSDTTLSVVSEKNSKDSSLLNHENQHNIENLNNTTNNKIIDKSVTFHSENKTHNEEFNNNINNNSNNDDNQSTNMLENHNSDIKLQEKNTKEDDIFRKSSLTSSDDVKNNYVHSNSGVSQLQCSVENRNNTENHCNTLMTNDRNICSNTNTELKVTEENKLSSQIISSASSIEQQQKEEKQENQQQQHQENINNKESSSTSLLSSTSSSSPSSLSSSSLSMSVASSISLLDRHHESSSSTENEKSCNITMMSSTDSELKSVSVMKQDIKQINEFNSTHNATNQDCSVGVNNNHNKSVDDSSVSNCNNSNMKHKLDTVQNDFKLDDKKLSYNNESSIDQNKKLENDDHRRQQQQQQHQQQKQEDNSNDHRVLNKSCDMLRSQEIQNDRLQITNSTEAISEDMKASSSNVNRTCSSVKAGSIETENYDPHVNKNSNENNLIGVTKTNQNNSITQQDNCLRTTTTTTTTTTMTASTTSSFNRNHIDSSWKEDNSKDETNVVSSSNCSFTDNNKTSTTTSQTVTTTKITDQNDTRNEDKNLNQNISTTTKDEIHSSNQNNTDFRLSSHQTREESINNDERKDQFPSTKVQQINSNKPTTCMTPTPSKIRHFFDQGHNREKTANSIREQNHVSNVSNVATVVSSAATVVSSGEEVYRRLPPKKSVSCVPADCSTSSSTNSSNSSGSFQKNFARDVYNETQRHQNPNQNENTEISQRDYYSPQNKTKENYSTVSRMPNNSVYEERIQSGSKNVNNSSNINPSNERQYCELGRSNNTTVWSPANINNESRGDKNIYNQSHTSSVPNYNKYPAHTTQSSVNVNTKKEYPTPYIVNESSTQKLKSFSMVEQQRDYESYRAGIDYSQRYTNSSSVHNFSRNEYDSREAVNSSNIRGYEKSIESVVKSSGNYQGCNSSSLYVNNPDFSKQMSHQNKPPSVSPSSSSTSLKQLHMKPPDFTKINSNSQQNIDSIGVTNAHQSSVLKSTKSEPSLYKHNNPQITEQNFAEISKKYNYISDLRLKNPPSIPSHYEDKSQSHQKSTTYSNLYMKAPGFSMQHFQNQRQAMEQEDGRLAVSAEQQTTVTSKPSAPLVESQIAANSIKHTNAPAPYTRHYPQLSHDVEMSVVSSKSFSSNDDQKQRQNKANVSPMIYNQYQNYSKEMMPYSYEQQQQHLRDNTPKTSIANVARESPHVQQQQQPQQQQQQRHEYSPVPLYANSTHSQKRDVSPRNSTHLEHQQQQQQHLQQSSIQSQSQQQHRNQSSHHPSMHHQPYNAAEYLHKSRQQLSEQNYNEKDHYSYHHAQPAVQSVIQQNIKPKERHQEYPAHHQIQSPQPRISESPVSNSSLGRQVQGSPYYHMGQQQNYQQQQQQQPSPLPHVQSVGKNTPPSPITVPSGRTYNQSHPSPSSSSSPQCPPPGMYKTSPSPGAMNPPYGWSNHMTNSRISQSPVASPHYRITQSPVTPNAPSPQSQIFRQPSPKPSRSPTHLKSSPQMSNVNVNTNYKNSYPSNQNYYPVNETVRAETRVISANYAMKAEKLPEKPYSEATISPHYRSTQEQKSTEHYTQKNITSKHSGYPDYACPPRAEQLPKIPQKYMHAMEAQYPSPSTKYSDQQMATSRHHEKPNYREMINHVYAIRNATSEEDLNYEIIKRTLNKDISVRRSDSDLSKNIFDCPVPTKISHTSGNSSSRSTDNIHYMKPYEPSKRLENSITNKYAPPSVPYETLRKSSVPDLKKTGIPENIERLERRPSLPGCNDLIKNDISVTVSKVIKPTNSEKSKLQERESPQCSRNLQPHISEYSNVVISRVDASHSIETNVPVNCRPRDLSIQQQHQHSSTITEAKKPPPVLSPVKRESPLDLSVKTVKTKADSTGCDEYSTNYYSRSTAATSSQSLKVDFSPNFSKHTAAIASDVRQNVQPQTVYNNYDTRHASTVRTSQKPKQQTCPQQVHHQYPATPSQSNTSMPTIQKASPIPHQTSHHPLEIHQYPSHGQSNAYQKIPESYQQPTATRSNVNHSESNICNSNKFPQAYMQNKMPSYPVAVSYDNESYKYHQQNQPMPLSKTHQSHQLTTGRLPSPSLGPKREFEHSPHLSSIQKMEYPKSLESNNNDGNSRISYPTYSHENRKDNQNYSYDPSKREQVETNRQSIILNPPIPSTVYDKKSGDYLINTPQKQKKIPEKNKTMDFEGSKTKDRTDFTVPTKDPYAPLPIQKFENPYTKISQEDPNVYKTYVNDSRHFSDPYYRQQMDQQIYNQTVNYNHQQLQSHVYRDKAQEEYFKNMEVQKSSTKLQPENKKPEPQLHYVPDAVRNQEYKSNTQMNIPNTVYSNEAKKKIDYSIDKYVSDYSRKRQHEPSKEQQPPEKQVRVDELYRAHLEKTYRQQQQFHHHQQPQQPQSQPQPQLQPQSQPQPQYPQHVHFGQNSPTYQKPRPESRSEISMIPKQDLTAGNRKEPTQLDYTNKNVKGRYPPYREEYQQIVQNSQKTSSSPSPSSHQVPAISQQHPPDWYSSTSSVKESASQSCEVTLMKREQHVYPAESKYSPNQGINELHKSFESNNRSTFAPPPVDVSQKPPITSTPPNSSNGTIGMNRGVDQNVLSKLRNSIEMREHEKQKTSVNKKPTNEDPCEEESKPTDIASLLAARIRTKGELKGYTPLPPRSQDKTVEDEINSKSLQSDIPPQKFEAFSDEDGHSTFDLMDWGSACNDFVEQLQTGTTKKRGKRRKSQKTVSDNTDLESEKAFEKSLPGVEYSGDIDRSLVEKIKTEGIRTKTKVGKTESECKDQGQTSSDEDKPLLLLRQQSSTDATVLGQSDIDRKSLKINSIVKDNKTQESDGNSMDRINRNSLVERLSEKIGRNLREKQRLEQEKRIAARIGSSTSDSEDEIKRAFQRPKKLTRKPRSRASGASTRELSDTSSGAEDKSMSRNLVRSRRESRKRKLGEKTSTESDSNFNAKKQNLNLWTEDSDEKTKSSAVETPVKREFITKARVKCMKLPSETSEDSDDADEGVQVKTKHNSKTKDKSKNDKNNEFETKNSKKIKDEPLSDNDEDEDEDGNDSKKIETESTNSKNVSEDESKSAQTPTKNEMKKVPPLRLSRENFKTEETMTRSKRKKELEQRMANSKILRNEKIVQNTTFGRKTRPSEKASNKYSKQDMKSVVPDKSKNLKRKNSVDLKRKHNDNDMESKIRKKVSRFQSNETESSSSESSEEESKVSDRLRSKRLGFCNESSNSFQNADFQKPPKKQQRCKEKNKEEVEKKNSSVTNKSTNLKKSNSNKTKSTESEPLNNTQTFPPGWEMEVYQYKRALKVPPNLITIKGPAHHRVSTSLPDLDPHSSDASESLDNSKNLFRRVDDDHTECSQSSSISKSAKKGKPKKESKVESSDECEPRSIIDVLHSRLKTKKSKKNIRVFSNNEPKILPRGSNEAELLPTPVVKENKPPFGSEHRNLFETEILKSRTRTESRVLKTKELIREVFGGEDRPASAPPELRNVENDIKMENISFDEKYEQYLQKMNVDFGEKIRKNKKGTISIVNNDDNLRMGQMPIDVSQIKQEKIDDMSPQGTGINQDDEETRDTEINACMQNTSNLNIKEETQDTNERDTPSVISERDDNNTPLLFSRKKTHKNRNGRRKGGSSGFDYIRKKKKPSTNNNTAGSEGIRKKRMSPIDLQPTRSEEDVSKEIQKWVLNKSVGQSALHKAARLGYLDVIAYCLERLGMHPDPKDNAGYTPLHEACSKGRLEIARVLLQYGANHSETAHSGIRPLHEASESGCIEIVRLLLSYGADPLVTTYSGQTPLMLAENHEMEVFLKNHLHDVQNTGPHKQPWRLPGPWLIFDPDEYGYDVLAGAPEFNDIDEDENDDSQNSPNKDIMKPIIEIKKTKEKCDSNSNIMCYEDKGGLKAKFRTISAKSVTTAITTTTTATTKSINRRRSTYYEQRNKETKLTNNRHDNNIESDLDGDVFEFEESEMPLPPLYLLKDEGTEKWVLLNDLCNLLKVKSKDTLLKQICPSIPPSTVNKELLRELKTTDFLEKAICLQLLCAGEKLNIRSSKVVLVKYNENVRNVLGVKTITMKF